MTLLLSVVASGKGKGIDLKTVEFLNNAKLSGIWTNISDIHRSALTRARKKLGWTIFEATFKKSVSMAYNFLPVNDHSVLWHGKKVFAVDGSKFDLPATKAIREEFDPESGLEYEGKGHYPQCLVTTVYDVFRRIPVARSVAGLKSSEREEFKTLLPQIPQDSVLLFDRGYPSYEMIHCLNNNYNGNFIFRCPATSTFPAVHEFIKSNKTEEIIQILPSDKFVKKTPYTQRKSLEAIKIRA
ncbi:MAG: transposase, partial [Patescibacteria group bacterium]